MQLLKQISKSEGFSLDTPIKNLSKKAVETILHGTGEARYKVTACGDGLCAKLVWLREDQRTDKNLAVLNKYVVRGASQTDGNEWQGNVVFDGKTYDGKMTLVSKNSMTLKGCSGIICQTYQLSRI